MNRLYKELFCNNYKFYDQDNYQFDEIIKAFEYVSKLKVCILFKTHYEIKPFYKSKIFLERNGHFNKFCSLIKSSPKLKGCDGYDGILRAKKASVVRKPLVDECPCGVVELIIPLIVRGEFIGTIFCGQIRKYKSRTRGFDYIWEKVRGRECDKDNLYQAYNSFHYYTQAELLLMGNLFFCALSNIADSLDDATIERSIKLQQNHIIKDTMAILQDTSSHFPTAGEICRKLGITREYFSRLFRKVMNKNFITYITELRIARAQELLTNTTLPIVDIAAEVGYEGQSYFTKKFKELSGITPMQFRAASTLLSKK